MADSFPDVDFHGFDIAVMAGTLRFGKHDRVERVLLARRRTNPDSYAKLASRGNPRPIDRVIPYRLLTHAILKQNLRDLSFPALYWLALRNIYEHLRHWATTENAYGGFTRVILEATDPIRRKAVAPY